MKALTMVTVFSLLSSVPVLAVDPAPLPKEIRVAKTVFIINESAENVILDNVYDRFKKWPRWALTEERETADLLVVLSARSYFYGMMNIGTTTNSTATATTYGNTTVAHGSSTSQNTGVPLLSYPRYLTVVDPKTGNALLTISCELRMSKGYTAKVLMDRLKQRFPKSER
jgi:hypothetical protein